MKQTYSSVPIKQRARCLAALLLSTAGPVLHAQIPADAPKNVVPQIVKYLRGVMKDPYSMRDMRVCPPGRDSDGTGWHVNFQMNAKNSYGGYAGPTYFIASFVGGSIRDATSPDLGPALNARTLELTAGCPTVSDSEIQKLLKAPG